VYTYIFSPEGILLILGFLILIIYIFRRRWSRFLLITGALALLLAAFSSFLQFSLPPQGDVLLVDPFSNFFEIFFLFASFLTLLLSKEVKESVRGSYIFLILFATLGMMLVASTGELLFIYLNLTLVSLALYALVSSVLEAKSREAGLKFMFLGIFSSLFFLYGLSLLFGQFRTTYLSIIESKLGNFSPHYLFISLVLILVGLGFKIGMVPFHFWIPDTYEGAPTPIAAFLSVASKAVGVTILIRIFIGAFFSIQQDWQFLLALLAIITMTVGNLFALVQTNIKRMLAYSSIAQSGYILIGVLVGSKLGVAGALFYLWCYLFANMAAFFVVAWVEKETTSQEITAYSGLSRRSPFLAVTLTVALLSLAGVPPFAGFVGKFYVFSAAAFEGQYLLVAFALANTVISLYYYLQVVKEMFIVPSNREVKIKSSFLFNFLLLLQLVGILMLGLYPFPWAKLAEGAIVSLF
jgi:NADH-quinone oxidoreductase subunit N